MNRIAPSHATRISGTVAVVGMACRFPGGVEDVTAYWSLLMNGRTGIVEIPANRWNPDIFYSAAADTRGKMRTRWGGFLAADVFGFDPAFFDMSPREVTSMDPQQRLLLQVAFEAAQDSGMRLRDLQAARTGVFIGMSTSDFGQRQQDGSRTDIFAGTGTAFSIAANRLSHRFDLRGPSMTIDTACSSALVAIDQAVNSILSDDCDMALAGGVNCMLDPRPFIAFSTANMLSTDGAIYTFDSRANGFVRGEGCGLVLLKSLSKAIADGNRIYGVVRQTAVNQDGHTKTLTSPSGEAQEAMLRDLVNRAGIAPSEVGYVEAHGTGTPVGDPIEATAIGRVFGIDREAPVWVGSFKPNLGHLESGSGVAGFIKAVLTVHHGVVPPNRNFSKPNPAIPFDALAIRVPTEASAFGTPASQTRMSVVNSFGFGGTNAAALVEEWRPSPRSGRPQPLNPAPMADDTRPLVVPVSSGSRKALQLWAGCLSAETEGGQLAHEDVTAIAGALWRRDGLADRAALIIPPRRAALVSALAAVAEGRDVDSGPQGPTVFTGRMSGKPRLALAFSGQGGQWWAMSRRLIQEEPVFRRTVEMVGEALKPLMGWSLMAEMTRDEETSRINEADRTQGSIFANQIGLYEMWKARGIEPELLIGHSFGEIAATYVAGVLDLDTVARIIAARGRIPFGSTRRGAMATLGLTVEQLLPLLPEDGSAVIAAYNGPVAQTVAGMEASVEQVMKTVAEQYPDALVRRLTMNFGWHSEHLDDCEAAFRNEVGPVAWKSPALPIVSTVTGILQTGFDLDYWWDNLRQPVSFTKAINFCLGYGIDTFLEIGPHRTLTPLIRGIAQESERTAVAVNSLDRKEDDYWTMARAEAQLFIRGVDFGARQDVQAPGTIWNLLPKMPWANQHLSSITPSVERFLFEAPRHALLGKRDPGPEPRWTNELLLQNFKYIADHRVNGDTLFPAVGYLEIMGAALRDQYGEGPVEIRDFRIHDALSLASDDIVEMRTELDPRSGRLRIFTEHRGAGDGWRLRAEAYGWRHDYALPARPEIAAPVAGAVSVTSSAFYGVTRRFGLEYGPQFRLVDALWRSGDVHLRARLQRKVDALSAEYYAFPGMFDGILQACILFDIPAGQEEKHSEEAVRPARLVLPVGARRVLLARPLSTSLWVDAECVIADGQHRLNFSCHDDAGESLLMIEGLETRALSATDDKNEDAGEVFTERFEIAQLPAPREMPTRRRWLLAADDEAVATRLVEALTAQGASVERADIKALLNFDSAELSAELASFCGAAAEPAGILFCWDGGASALAEDSSGDDVLAAAQSATEALVTVARAMSSLQTGNARPKLAVVTRMARQLGGDPPMTLGSVAASSAVGLARTISNELAEFRAQQFDADDLAIADGELLATLLMADGPEPEYLLRNGGAHVVRLEKRKIASLDPALKPLSFDDPKANFRVTMTNPGIIDNIRLRETAFPEPLEGEVIVEVAAVGLNFRDVMAASGILPDELEGEDAYWNNLGLEFSGTVAGVGAGITEFAPGDRVMGMGKGYLRRYARARAGTLMRVPNEIDLSAAASMPVAYLTAHYSLAHVGRTEPGEKVLVQLASGGVGLAALEVCRHLGAEVLGTAGSEEKRAYLRERGINHVMDSRTLDFAREVRLATGGRGVDVVLNALSGAGIDKSLECLAPFGRLVEIGKRDLADDKPIGLKSLYWNNSYSVVDLSTLPIEKPALFVKLLREVEALIAAGVYTPLKSVTFPATEAAHALRTLARAHHIGKIIVSLDAREVTVEQDIGRPISFRSDGAYLVTGGLKGFGAEIGHWASASGAGKVILANRAGKPDEAASELIRAMEARGTVVECAALDVTDGTAVAALVNAHAAGTMPLRGIFHAAAVIEDAFLTQLDREKIRRVLAPKIAGAQALDKAVRAAGLTLDHFVLFSSIAQLIGSPGQANYTAANSVLNAFADYRAGRGGPAHAVAWGMIGGSGFVARSETLSNYLDSMGIRAVSDTEAAVALGSLMRSASHYAAFARIDWTAVTRAYPAIAGNPKIKPILEQAEGGQSRIQAELMALPRTEWEAVLGQLIRGEVARVLKADTAVIAVDKKLTELGLDSLSSFELKNRIEARVDVSIPVARFLQAPTIAGLSRLVAAAFESKIKATEAAIRATAGSGQTDAAGAATFRPLTRQVDALLTTTRIMTSRLAAADGTIVLRASCTAGEDFAERLKTLCHIHDALRLAAVQRVDGSLGIEMGEEPLVQETAGDLTLPGPLWRFEALSEETGLFRFTVKAHRAAADVPSVRRVLRQWMGEEDIPAAALSFAAAAAALEQGEDTASRINDLAYWREILSRAPVLAHIGMRRRAAAPAGYGNNRGKVMLFSTRIAGAGRVGEARLLASYGAALGPLLGLDRLLIERHGRPATPELAQLVGPLATSHPIILEAEFRPEQVADLVAGAGRHSGVDTPVIEAVMADDLRLSGVSLRQFGFALAQQGDVSPVPLSSNEVLLVGEYQGTDLALTIAIDTDVLPDGFGHQLAEAFLGALRRQDVTTSDDIVFSAPLCVTAPEEAGRAHAPALPASRTSPGFGELPLTTNQSNLLQALCLPGADPEFARFWAPSRMFRVAPQVDVDRLSVVLRDLRSRHEALRTRFVRKDNGALQALLRSSPAAVALQIEEFSDLETAEGRARTIAATSIDPFLDELVQVHVIRVGNESDIIIARGHHLILDGYSLGLIVEEMVQLYLGMSLPEVEIDTQEFIRTIDLSHDRDAMRRRDAYLATVFAEPVPTLPNIYAEGFSRALGLVAEPCSTIDVMLDEQVLARLKNKWRREGCTLSTMLAAAFGQMIGRWGGVDDVALLLPTARRYDLRLRNYVNWVADSHFVRVPVRMATLRDAALGIAATLDRNPEFAPSASIRWTGEAHEKILQTGSYIDCFSSSMLTGYRGGAGALSSQLQPGLSEREIDLGFLKISPVAGGMAPDLSLEDVHLRSFEEGTRTGFRFVYKNNALSASQARDMLTDVLERMGFESKAHT
jgi:acyl transferase domain-containing protein/NADPH:quinone reductase-like Zn-dependent oxidoreductase/acyl carrier protein